jgi:hypothetical protein
VKRTIFAIPFLALAVGFSACGNADSGRAGSLTVDSGDDSRSSGSFADDGMTVRYDLARNGSDLNLDVRDANDDLLYSAERRGDRLNVSYFDGEITLEGSVDSLNPSSRAAGADAPRVSSESGDLLEQIETSPEFALVERLSSALDAEAGSDASGLESKSADVQAAGCNFIKRAACSIPVTTCHGTCAFVLTQDDSDVAETVREFRECTRECLRRTGLGTCASCA